MSDLVVLIDLLNFDQINGSSKTSKTALMMQIVPTFGGITSTLVEWNNVHLEGAGMGRGSGENQCDPGSITRLGIMCGLSLSVLFSAQRGFSPVAPDFSSPQKPTFDFNL